MDHPGFHALRSQARRGGHRVEAHFLGGVADEYFPGARVRFYANGREVRARVRSARPDAKSGNRFAVLDAGGPVEPGAFGTWDLPGFRRAGRDKIETRAADDLAGVAAVLALLDAAPRIDPRRRVDVRGCLTRAEEVGFVGAMAVARGRRLPRGARILAIEASKALPNAPQGGGPILRVGDRTSIFDDLLTRWIARVGDGLPFAWQRRLMDGGTCESTAYQLEGFRCAAMCLPLGNYHNMDGRGRIAAESIHLSDLVGLVRFFEALVRAEARGEHAGDPLRARLEQNFRRRRRALAEPA
jgi:endoglucanase